MERGKRISKNPLHAVGRCGERSRAGVGARAPGRGHRGRAKNNPSIISDASAALSKKGTASKAIKLSDPQTKINPTALAAADASHSQVYQPGITLVFQPRLNRPRLPVRVPPRRSDLSSLFSSGR